MWKPLNPLPVPCRAQGNSPAEQLEKGFEICLSRTPSKQELDRLVALYEEVRSDYSKDLGTCPQDGH
jgi:hypothetical protein